MTSLIKRGPVITGYWRVRSRRPQHGVAHVGQGRTRADVAEDVSCDHCVSSTRKKALLRVAPGELTARHVHNPRESVMRHRTLQGSWCRH